MLENPTLEEKLDLIVGLLERIKEELDKGREWIWVNKKLLKWVDKQVETGKYPNRSHAVEEIIRGKMGEERRLAYTI